MRLLRHATVSATLALCACATTRRPAAPTPDATPPLPHPLIDASAYVEGDAQATATGWRFEGPRGAAEMAWPPWPAEPTCAKLDGPLLAWPIRGSDRLLVLADEPLVVEPRAGCLAAVPVRPSGGPASRRTVPVDLAASRVPLAPRAPVSPDAALDALALVFDEAGALPRLEGPAGAITPEGAELDDDDAMDCWQSDGEDHGDLQVEPARRTVDVVRSGAGADDVVELVIVEACSGDPSAQGGAVRYEREVRWGLARDAAAPRGWRQVRLVVQSDQRSSGDGSTIARSKRQSVFAWTAGPSALVGRVTSTRTDTSSNFGDAILIGSTSAWWLVGAGHLAGGLDALVIEDLGLRLAPPSAAPEREPDVARRGEGAWPVGPACTLTLGEDHAEIACGEAALALDALGDTAGEITREASVWDLGPALVVEVTLAREHVFTEPLSDDDPSPVELTAQESRRVRALVSERGGAPIELERARGNTSF